MIRGKDITAGVTADAGVTDEDLKDQAKLGRIKIGKFDGLSKGDFECKGWF